MIKDIELIIRKYIHRYNISPVLKELIDVTSDIQHMLSLRNYDNTGFVFVCITCKHCWCIEVYRNELYCLECYKRRPRVY